MDPLEDVSPDLPGVKKELEEETDSSSPEELSEEDFHFVLKNDRRRALIRCLKESDGPREKGDIAEDIAIYEKEESSGNEAIIDSSDRKNILSQLMQLHLPKLNERDIVDYDADEGKVYPGDNFSVIKPFTGPSLDYEVEFVGSEDSGMIAKSDLHEILHSSTRRNIVRAFKEVDFEVVHYSELESKLTEIEQGKGKENLESSPRQRVQAELNNNLDKMDEYGIFKYNEDDGYITEGPLFDAAESQIKGSSLNSFEFLMR